ncbi:MAG: CBS domain-containing protein, partial [Pseudomonadota bacterium]
MLVSDILRNKSGDVITGAADDTVAEIAARLAAHGIGAVPVTDDDGGVLGILSERDIVRGLARNGTGCLKLKAADLMTAKVISCAADDTIKHVME